MRHNRIIATALGIALAASPCVMASTTAFAVEPGDNATVSVQAGTEPSVGDFLTAASQVKVYVNGTEYKDFDYMKGIDATKLMTTKKAEATYTGIPYGATVEVRNIPENMKDYIGTVPVADGVDVVASASGYTVTYHFVYDADKPSTPGKDDTGNKGDAGSTDKPSTGDNTGKTDPTTPGTGDNTGSADKPGTGSTTDPTTPGGGTTDKPSTGDNTGSTTDPTTPGGGDNTDTTTPASNTTVNPTTPNADGTATTPSADLATTGVNVTIIAGAVAILAALGAGLAFILHRGKQTDKKTTTGDEQ